MVAMRRSVRKRYDQLDAAETRARSRAVKPKERARREVRMVEKLGAGTLPYAPAVMSWLSRKLGKKATRITPEDVQAFLS